MKLKLSLALYAVAISASISHAADTIRVYIGTYTGGESKGIYTCEISEQDGSLQNLRLAAENSNPSYLAIHPGGKFLYSVNEVSNYKSARSGSATAFSINGDHLVKINDQSTVGDGPCYISVDASGKFALVANYAGGSVVAFPIAADGSLQPHSAFVQHEGSSVNPDRQKEPHAHSINMDRENRFAIAADLGLDKLLVYKLDRDAGTLTPNEPAFVKVPPGSGPRHLSFTPNGKFAYVNGEMSNTVIGMKYDPRRGSFEVTQTLSTLPEDWHGASSTAQTQVHPNGKFLYVSNRGHDSIAIYQVDRSGRLTYVENVSTGGKTPRNFEIDPSGKFLVAANQDSNNLAVFKIDPKTGRLKNTGNEIRVGKPVCVKFLAIKK
jgi:6-phosphogluconolactonase